MRILRWLAGPVTGLALGMVATAAGAAPAGSGLGELKNDPATASAVESVYWTVRCNHYRGREHCYRRWVEPLYFAPPVIFFGARRHYGARHYGGRRR